MSKTEVLNEFMESSINLIGKTVLTISNAILNKDIATAKKLTEKIIEWENSLQEKTVTVGSKKIVDAEALIGIMAYLLREMLKEENFEDALKAAYGIYYYSEDFLRKLKQS